MPSGDKSSYTNKQKRQAAHIEESEEARGVSSKRAKKIGWATVNKQSGGGLKRTIKHLNETHVVQRSACVFF
jgi:hypothetical protein